MGLLSLNGPRSTVRMPIQRERRVIIADEFITRFYALREISVAGPKTRDRSIGFAEGLVGLRRE
jgi:hypothetical protein